LRNGVSAVIDYLHANPVRKNLVESAVDWQWSSARFYAGMSDVVLAIDRPDMT
jgi:putative transposase